MTEWRQILKDYQDSGALNALVNVHAAVDDHTFLTKGGDLVMVLAIQGADYECLDASELDQIARRFESALRVFDEHIRLYQYLMKRDHAVIPSATYENPVVHQAVTSRMAYLRGKADELYSLDIYFAVVYEGWREERDFPTRFRDFLTSPLERFRHALSPRATIILLEEDLDQARQALSLTVMNFIVQLPESIRAQLLDKQRAYRFFRRLLNYAPHKIDGVRLKDVSTRKTSGEADSGAAVQCGSRTETAVPRATVNCVFIVPMSCLHFILGSFGRVGD